MTPQLHPRKTTSNVTASTITVQLPCCAVGTSMCTLDNSTCSLHRQVVPAHFNIQLDRGLPTVKLDVMGDTVNALVDTGSAITLIDSKYQMQHPSLMNLRLAPSEYRLTSAASQPMITKGQIMLPLVLQDHKKCWPAVVTDNLAFPVILGYDFINQVLLPPVQCKTPTPTPTKTPNPPPVKHSKQHTVQNACDEPLQDPCDETENDYEAGPTIPIVLCEQLKLSPDTFFDFALPCRLVKGQHRARTRTQQLPEELIAGAVTCLFQPAKELRTEQASVAGTVFPLQYNREGGTLMVPLQVMCMGPVVVPLDCKDMNKAGGSSPRTKG